MKKRTKLAYAFCPFNHLLSYTISSTLICWAYVRSTSMSSRGFLKTPIPSISPSITSPALNGKDPWPHWSKSIDIFPPGLKFSMCSLQRSSSDVVEDRVSEDDLGETMDTAYYLVILLYDIIEDSFRGRKRDLILSDIRKTNRLEVRNRPRLPDGVFPSPRGAFDTLRSGL